MRLFPNDQLNSRELDGWENVNDPSYDIKNTATGSFHFFPSRRTCMIGGGGTLRDISRISSGSGSKVKSCVCLYTCRRKISHHISCDMDNRTCCEKRTSTRGAAGKVI
jgi:hypothetical protein